MARSLLQLLRFIAAGLLAVLLGLFGMMLMFSDLGPNETMLLRYLTIFIVFVFGGLIVGSIAGKRFWYLAALCSSAGVLFGCVTARFGFDRVLVFAMLPLFLSLIGGYSSVLLGNVFRRWSIKRR
jgi:hypothetical protein